MLLESQIAPNAKTQIPWDMSWHAFCGLRIRPSRA
jgi:hypothetical protein